MKFIECYGCPQLKKKNCNKYKAPIKRIRKCPLSNDFYKPVKNSKIVNI